MKLATLDNGTRDGRLVVVSKDLTRCCAAGYIAPTLQYALDNWDRVAPELEVLARDVEQDADRRPVEHQCEHRAVGAARAVGLGEHVECVALCGDRRFGLGLAGGARQRPRRGDEADDIGALGGEARGSLRDPRRGRAFVRMAERLLDHVGMAGVKQTELVHRIGQVAHRSDAGGEAREEAMARAAIGGNQCRQRARSSAKSRRLHRLYRHRSPRSLRAGRSGACESPVVHRSIPKHVKTWLTRDSPRQRVWKSRRTQPRPRSIRNRPL